MCNNPGTLHTRDVALRSLPPAPSQAESPEYDRDPTDASDPRRITDEQLFSLLCAAGMHAVDLDTTLHREHGAQVDELTERAADYTLRSFAAILDRHAIANDPVGRVVYGTERATIEGLEASNAALGAASVESARLIQRQDNVIEALEQRLTAITAACHQLLADTTHSETTRAALRMIDRLASGEVR